MLTSSMSSIIGSDGQGVNLLHFCNGLNNVCQDPTVNTSPPFSLHHAAVIVQMPAVLRRWKAPEILQEK